VSRLNLLISIVAALALVLALAACGDGDGGGEVSGVQALSEDFCTEVEYGGAGDPDVLIASDLPKQGDSAERTEQMNDAIRLLLERQSWQAGQTHVAFQACDDSIEETGEWDAAKCRENAEAYADNPDLVGVIGTYNSGCAAEMIPILNEAPNGVAMVSPGNTLVCLTQPSKTCEEDEPDRYYPTGKRNYARVVPNDAFQGAALANFADQQEITNPYVLFAQDDPVSLGQGETFRNAAEALDITVAGFSKWDPEAVKYLDLMEEVEATGADAVVLAGLLEQNGAKLIKDKVAVLGPNLETETSVGEEGVETETASGGVRLLAFDGFAQQATIDDAGEAAAGMFVSTPGKSADNLIGPGRTLVEELQAELGEGATVELFAPYAAQAAEVMLQAIAEGAERAQVIQSLFGLTISSGIVGNFAIEESGDPSVGPISISIAREDFQLVNEITPQIELAAAARGEDVEIPEPGTSTTTTVPSQ
jgi:branched-chain amino acid transport system substrate-binding protein